MKQNNLKLTRQFVAENALTIIQNLLLMVLAGYLLTYFMQILQLEGASIIIIAGVATLNIILIPASKIFSNSKYNSIFFILSAVLELGFFIALFFDPYANEVGAIVYASVMLMGFFKMFTLTFVFSKGWLANIDDNKITLKEGLKSAPILITISKLVGFLRYTVVVALAFIGLYLFNNNDYIVPISIIFAIGASIGMVLLPFLTQKIDYKLIFMVSSVVAIITQSLLWIFGYQSFALIVIGLFIIGFTLGLTTKNANFKDKSWDAVTKIITISLALIVFMLLLKIFRFVEPVLVDNQLSPIVNVSDGQSPIFATGLFATVTWIPMIGWLLGLIPMLFYPKNS